MRSIFKSGDRVLVKTNSSGIFQKYNQKIGKMKIVNPTGHQVEFEDGKLLTFGEWELIKQKRKR